MINWKALSKALLVLLCFCYCSKLLAVGDYNNFTWNNDIDYYKAAIDDSGIYADSTLTDWHWMLAGDPNDGEYTQDGFCFMYDGGNYGGTPFAVYNNIDITRCAFYGSGDYQNIEWYNFMDLNLIEQPFEYEADVIYTTDNLYADDSASTWTGCYEYNGGWNGTSGGACPSLQESGHIIFGYTQQTLTNIAAIDQALQGVGLETTGYTYEWSIKNADTNYSSSPGQYPQDPINVTIKIYDENQKVLFEKTYDYGDSKYNWTRFTGSEIFANPIDMDDIAELQLSVTGKDAGYWAGHYGPEFDNPDIRLNYRLKAEQDTTVEDLLFDQMCTQDPMYDPSCPGYQDAMLAAINVNVAADPTAEEPLLGADLAPSNDGTADPTGDDLVLADPVPVNDGTAEQANDGTGVNEEVAATEPAEAAGTQEESAIAEEMAATEEPAQEEPAQEEPAQEEPAQEQVAESSNGTSSKGGVQLSSTQLAALNAANAVANNAVGTAMDAASSSASIGLSETGGVSSVLTSDGVTNEQGMSSQMSDLIGGSTVVSNDIASISTTIIQDSASGSVSDAVSGSTQENGSSAMSTSSSTESDNQQQFSASIADVGMPAAQQDTVFIIQQDTTSADSDSQSFEVDQLDLTSTEVTTSVDMFDMQEMATTTDDFTVDAEQQTMLGNDIPEIEIPGLELVQQDFNVEQQEFEQSYVDQQTVDSVQTDDYYNADEDQHSDMSADEQFVMENIVTIQTEATDYGIEELQVPQSGTDNSQDVNSQDQQNTGMEFAITDAVETEDITGEEALAQANELAEKASIENMMPSVNAVPVLAELDFVGRFVADFVASLPELPVAQEVENKTEEEQRLEAFKDAVLLGQALKGDDSEDSKAALLGHNPNFGTYLTDQMKDAQFYRDKEIYTNKKNYDSPNAGLFNAGSDAKHKALIELQYKEEK